MKKVLLMILLLSTVFTHAKKVKFSVDMTGQTISPNGVHVSGDFQDEAGYGPDWNSDTTELIKETGSDIYSVVVNIPAFRKYEYKFVNGDKFYEVEFVPEKSRIGFDFNDNRWIYVDSLNVEITILPKLLFGGNAPGGQKMIRFKLDLSAQTINKNNGIHVAGNFNNWKPSMRIMVSFSNDVYESLEFVDSINIEYIFINGFIYEQVPAACSNLNKNRFLVISSDTVLSEVCFSKCEDCLKSGIKFNSNKIMASLIPNPGNGNPVLFFNNGSEYYTVSIKDYLGQEVFSFKNAVKELPINTGNWKKGLYFIDISTADNLHTTLKMIVD